MSDRTIAKQQTTRHQKSPLPMFLAYCLPALIFFGVFKYWPMIYSAVLSFAKWNFVSDLKWVGWSNYASMFSKAMFTKGLGNTFLYIVALLPFFSVIPLLLATLLLAVRNEKLQGIYKALYFMPTILAFSIICIVWIWMYNPTYGVLNNLLHMIGMDFRKAFFLICAFVIVFSP